MGWQLLEIFLVWLALLAGCIVVAGNADPYGPLATAAWSVAVFLLLTPLLTVVFWVFDVGVLASPAAALVIVLMLVRNLVASCRAYWRSPEREIHRPYFQQLAERQAAVERDRAEAHERAEANYWARVDEAGTRNVERLRAEYAEKQRRARADASEPPVC